MGKTLRSNSKYDHKKYLEQKKEKKQKDDGKIFFERDNVRFELKKEDFKPKFKKRK